MFKYKLGIGVFVVFLSLVKQSSSACGRNEFECDKDKCINIADTCDSIANCDDLSDEKYELCYKYTCPRYAFRCLYGGCIERKLICNGKADCMDGSDENKMLCLNETELSAYIDGLSGNCSKMYSYQCGNKCIDVVQICDGKYNCDDGSDETLELCANINCPSYATRCKYGACVRGKALCDGIQDCADGSDEFPEICNELDIDIERSNKTRSCRIPTQLPQLNIRDYDTRKPLKSGQEVPMRSIVSLGCAENNQLRGKDLNVCFEGAWIWPWPTCGARCSTEDVLKGVSTKAQCYYQDQRVECKQQLQAGAEIRFECTENYRLTLKDAVMLLICQPDGSWSKPAPICQPICGQPMLPQIDVRSSFVSSANNSPMEPWLVSIVKRNKKSNLLLYKCHGTILSAKIVLSVASCFMKTNNYRSDKFLKYKIIKGEVFEPINLNNSNQYEIYDVEKIINRSQMSADEKIYTLSFFVLKDTFIFSTSLMPICLQLKYTNSDDIVTQVHLKKFNRPGSAYNLEKDFKENQEIPQVTMTHIIYEVSREEGTFNAALVNVTCFSRIIENVLSIYEYIL